MWLIAGLGNPGQRYYLTRHNIGFMVIDLLARHNKIQISQHKYHSLIGVDRIGVEPVILAKPLTYMNRSGIAISELLSGFQLNNGNLMVISDDFHLPLGTIRIRRQGSSGGHHGLESIIDSLGTTQFARIRVGIGEPDGEEVVDYVLREFPENELEIIKDSCDKATQAVNDILELGINQAMNRFNSGLQNPDDKIKTLKFEI